MRYVRAASASRVVVLGFVEVGGGADEMSSRHAYAKGGDFMVLLLIS